MVAENDEAVKVKKIGEKGSIYRRREERENDGTWWKGFRKSMAKILTRGMWRLEGQMDVTFDGMGNVREKPK